MNGAAGGGDADDGGVVRFNSERVGMTAGLISPARFREGVGDTFFLGLWGSELTFFTGAVLCWYAS